MSEHRDNHYQVQVTEANLYVRKMSIRFFAIHVWKNSVENTRNTQLFWSFTNIFLATTGVQSWRQEDVTGEELVCRMIFVMSSSTAYLGTNRTNPFHNQKFQLKEIVVYRNG